MPFAYAAIEVDISHLTGWHGMRDGTNGEQSVGDKETLHRHVVGRLSKSCLRAPQQLKVVGGTLQ